jgi:hypothetical protein
MYLLHHSSTGTFSGVVDEPHEQVLRMKQPSAHGHWGKRWVQEVDKDQGDLVVLDHLLSL